MFKEFKAFALRGSVVDMAVGIIVGAAFGTIVSSLVEDILMPPIGLLLGGVDFSNLFAVIKAGAETGPYATLGGAQAAGAVTINYGLFINAIVSFLIVAAAIFLVIRAVNRLMHPQGAAAEEATTRECPYCKSSIPLAATRCPQCTSQLDAVAAEV
jgi:large conductance mechanosensitive channel